MIFPRKIIVPAGPVGVRAFAHLILAGKAEIADGDAMQRAGVCGAAAVGEGVKLLDIAKRMVRLGFDPGPQARLQRAVRELERAARQRARIRNRHDLGVAVGDRHQHGDKIGGDRIARTRCLGFSRGACHVYRSLQLAVAVDAAGIGQAIPVRDIRPAVIRTLVVIIEGAAVIAG